MPTYESSYPPNLYHASRPHSSRKSGLRLLANGRLGVSLRRFLTASNLLCLLWGYFLYWGERRVIKDAVRSCDWASWEDWPAGAAPERVVLVADPQLVDAHTYPGRNLLFQSLTEFYVDTYMHRAWESIESYLDSDATIFLGDLFDGGREWEHDEWVREYKRFDRVFPSRIGKLTVREVAGNHDIGFGDTISSEALNRFRAYFGDPNRVLEIGNHSFVVLDTNSMTNHKDEQIYKPARTFFESVAEDIQNTTSATLPRILLTHIPLYRDKDASCGPKREGSPSLPISRGYQYQTVVDPELSEEILDRLMPIAVFSGDDHDACEVEHVYAKGARKAVEYTVKSLSIAMGVSYPAFEMVSLYNPSAEDSAEQTTFQTKLCMLPSQFNIFKTYFKVLLFTLAVAAHAASRACTEATKQGKTAGVDFLSGGAGYVDKKDKSFRLYPAPVMMAFARYRAFKRSKTFARFCGRPGTFKREFLNRIAYVMCIVGAMYLYLVLRWK
ncbi:Metallo-dependent phosphatase-like protein [Myxozyma melibiosi]|uniref:Metallo-dependent phosphatase-like protein n=1 Tax=Myxozyma melibiosi TaxID=54550 RepID=A0ABR1F7F7_9ASCO